MNSQHGNVHFEKLVVILRFTFFLTKSVIKLLVFLKIDLHDL